MLPVRLSVTSRYCDKRAKHVKRQVSATWIDTTKTNNNNAIVENDCVGRAES